MLIILHYYTHQISVFCLFDYHLGKIPHGVTNFTLKDKGTYGGARAHGYGFSNYTLNNPRTGATFWSEFSVKQNADSNNDGICGIKV